MINLNEGKLLTALRTSGKCAIDETGCVYLGNLEQTRVVSTMISKSLDEYLPEFTECLMHSVFNDLVPKIQGTALLHFSGTSINVYNQSGVHTSTAYLDPQGCIETIAEPPNRGGRLEGFLEVATGRSTELELATKVEKLLTTGEKFSMGAFANLEKNAFQYKTNLLAFALYFLQASKGYYNLDVYLNGQLVKACTPKQTILTFNLSTLEITTLSIGQGWSTSLTARALASDNYQDFSNLLELGNTVDAAIAYAVEGLYVG